MSSDQKCSNVDRDSMPVDRISQNYYRSGTYLKAKHERVHYDSGRRFERWALDCLPAEPGWRVLDVGCGWGRFLWPLTDDLGISPHKIFAVDLSFGMLRTALEEARRRARGISVVNGDIDALPFGNQHFDLVIAAHVLYHLPDLFHGLHELARMLRPGGFLLATTNAASINPLVLDLHYRALENLGLPSKRPGLSSFEMENGAEPMRRVFDNVRAYEFEDTTSWPSAEAFLDEYQTLGRYRVIVEDETLPPETGRNLLEQVRRLAVASADQNGQLHSPDLLGAFVARA